MSDDKIVSYLEGQVPAYLQLLQKFVELESPSFEHKEASDKCSRFLERPLGDLVSGCSGFPRNPAETMCMENWEKVPRVFCLWGTMTQCTLWER